MLISDICYVFVAIVWWSGKIHRFLGIPFANRFEVRNVWTYSEILRSKHKSHKSNFFLKSHLVGFFPVKFWDPQNYQAHLGKPHLGGGLGRVCALRRILNCEYQILNIKY